MKRLILLFSILAMSLGAQAYTNVDGFDGETWLDYVDEDGFGGGNFGDGTENNPYQIRSAGALAYLARQVNNGTSFSNTCFVIAANIDLSYAPNGTSLVWVPIGCTTNPTSDNARVFKGTITNGTDANGKPYEIRGMTIKAVGTGTTNCFGLFGALRGTVDGLVLKDSKIYIDEITDQYFAGTVCGYLGQTTPLNTSSFTRVGTIRNCTAEQSYIEAEASEMTNITHQACIGGLVGRATLDINELKSNLAKSTMRLIGHLCAGGIAGWTEWETFDCHAVVDISMTNNTEKESLAGGVVGFNYAYSSNSVSKNTMKCCTASGEIKGTVNNITMGGITGFAQHLLEMDYCTTCVSLSGGHTEGGLIGRCYSMSGSDGMIIDGCYSSSYVDGSQSTYAGGLLGYVEFDWRAANNNNTSITPCDNVRFSNFAGTMKKPTSSNYYGSIVGYVKGYKKSGYLKFGYFRRDYRQCSLQTNSNGWVDDGDDLALATYFTPHPVDGDFEYDDRAWSPESYMVSQLNSHLFYKDNMRLAGIPFNVTNDLKCFYDVWDTTIDFQIGPFRNKSTNELVATFTLPTPPSCVEVNENTVKVLDPGEADVMVNYNGLQRKVHLNITYGQPWDGTTIGWRNYNDYFAGGDGTEKNPYVIHNIQEFILVMSSYNYSQEAFRYNLAGKHFILANDLFFNTHLLGEDEQPKEGAITFYPLPLYATLHGNGKTIYGLKCIKELSETDGSGLSGLFTRVSGKVEDLAVVDAYVQSSGSGPGISAGIICAELLENGSIERCLAHGIVQSNGYAGGICGSANERNTRIADCFAAVHIGWPGEPENFIGAGIVGGQQAKVVRCVSIGKMEHYNEEYGITQYGSSITDCWFDRQMLSQDNTSAGSTYTKDMISGKILTNASAWQNEEYRYPMLRQFASTPYGDLLSMAVRFDEGDRAGNITKIFDFPTENVRWWARSGNTYLDVINECGAAAPNRQTGDFTEHLLSEPVNSKSACTKALRSIAVNVRADKAGIEFKDDAVKSAALTAFDADGDNLVTLREAFTADAAKFNRFNQNASGAETFNELHYFAGITTLQKDMISGLDCLREIQLPPSLTTIGTNAFNGCASLADVELPAKFQTLAEGGFYGSGIKNILVAKRNPSFQSIAGALYKNDPLDDLKVMLMAYPPGRGEEDATLSAPLSKILPYAIYKVPGLKNVYIDNCLPEGEMAELEEDGIIHEDEDDLMQIYVNDGSFDSKLFQDYYDDDTWGDLYYDEGHLDIYYPLNVTDAMWATLYIDFDTELPEGLKAFIADVPDEDNNTVELHSIGRIIPASTPVAIKAEESGLYPLYKYNGTLPEVDKWENRFIGTFIGQNNRWGTPTNQETSNEGNTLTLGRNKNGQVGFFKYNGTLIPPYRAYLTRNNIIEGPTSLTIAIGDDIDGISQPIAPTEKSADAAVYDLSGRRISASSMLPKGIYIIHGKKVVIR